MPLWYLATGIFVHFPLDSPYLTMVKMARITNKSLSPSTILYINMVKFQGSTKCGIEVQKKYKEIVRYYQI